MVIEPRFQHAGLFQEGIAPAMERDRWGFINRTGAWVVEPIYEKVLQGSGGRFAVRLDGRWGFVDSSGKIVIKPVYDDAQPFKDGVAAVLKDHLWGYIGPTGREEIKFEFQRATAREGGFAAVEKSFDDSPEWVVLDGRGEMVSLSLPQKDETEAEATDNLDQGTGEAEDPTSASSATAFSEGYTISRVGKSTYAIGRLLDKALGPYKDMRPFRNGLGAVTSDGRTWRFVDAEGKDAISGNFNAVREFSGGAAPVRIGDKWGYVDRTGKILLEPTYDDAYPFREGLALVRRGDKRGFVSMTNGRIAEWLAPTYDDAYAYSEGLAPVKKGEVWGYIDGGAAPPIRREIADLTPN
ncbi:WG repeat-containing protein [Kaistia algarum]|uniref:WG repeat-containing protein n=1 Tax=Kaistia algarum TaxID=2083279 RepID=UPI001402A7F4|nr:WG repeat-containing protein [Kaistia algarum]MCX5513000.1 WG repeat-containing protein [Kaistia algarum]